MKATLGYRQSFWWALALHVIVLALLIIQLSFHDNAPPASSIIQDVMISSSTDLSYQSNINQNQQQQAIAQVKVARAKAAAVQQQKIKVAQQQIAEQAKLAAQAKAAAIQQQKIKAAQQQAAEQAKLAAQAKAAAIQQQKIKAAQQQAAEQAKLAAQAKAVAIQQQKTKAVQQQAAIKKQLQQQILKNIKQEMTNHSATDTTKNTMNANKNNANSNAIDASLLAKYKAIIIQAISEQWSVPPQLPKNLSCQLSVQLAPGGTVIKVAVIKSSGSSVLDNSAVAAVNKASPLPIPDDPDLFNQFQTLHLTVRPDGSIQNS